MAKTVFDVLRDKINEDKASLQVFLSGGGAKDFAEYRELTGKIRGYGAKSLSVCKPVIKFKD